MSHTHEHYKSKIKRRIARENGDTKPDNGCSYAGLDSDQGRLRKPARKFFDHVNHRYFILLRKIKYLLQPSLLIKELVLLCRLVFFFYELLFNDNLNRNDWREFLNQIFLSHLLTRLFLHYAFPSSTSKLTMYRVGRFLTAKFDSFLALKSY